MATAAELAHWRDFWGDLGDRSNPFGSPGKVYTKGYHRGEDVSNHGEPETVPCLRPGRVVWAGRANLIGFFIVVDPDGDDRYDIYCHMHEGSAKRTGKVGKADPLGRTADWGEDPGGGWDGPHLHFVVADAVAGGYDVRIREHDPRPIIQAALAGKFDPAPRPAGAVASAVRAALGISRKDITVINLFNKDDKNDETRRAAVGELTFEVQGPGASTIDRRFWGRPLNVNQAEWNRALAGVNKRRKQAGLHELKGIRGEV